MVTSTFWKSSKKILLINSRENIVSISTSFKNNIPSGETNILYKNGTKIILQLNEFGFYCGAHNEDNELIKIKQLIVDENLEWVQKHDFDNDKEVIALCKNKENLDIWLDAVSKKTFHFSGYKKVIYKSILVGCNCTHLKEYFSNIINSFYFGDLKSLQL